MNAFVAMRRFIVQNAGILMRISHLERHQIETDEKIDIILDKMEENSPKILPEQIFQTGCVWDAWSYVSNLVRSAKQRIVLIDNFVDDRVLSMLDKRAEGVSATIHSRYYEQFQTDLKKHNEQYPAIEFVQLPHKNHDRFLIIDDKVYLMGASLKDMGAGRDRGVPLPRRSLHVHRDASPCSAQAKSACVQGTVHHPDPQGRRIAARELPPSED